jgi:transmembrane sensor
MDYSNFKTEDFLHDAAFIAWVKTGEGDAFWQNFIKGHSSQQTYIFEAKTFIETVSHLPIAALSETAKAEMWQRIVFRTQENLEETADFELKPIKTRKTWWAVAASLTILAAASVWFFTQNSKLQIQNWENTEGGVYAKNIEKAQSNSTNLTEWTNENDVPRTIDLADGSRVVLKKGSRLSLLPNVFNAIRREVFLSGEAFFDIAKNAEKPFLVYANETVTKVLGTSFTVKSFPKDAKVTVSVKTGKVSVFSKKDLPDTDNLLNVKANGVLLTPNQQAIFTRQTEQLVKTLVEKPEVLASNTEGVKISNFDFNFNQTPIAQVFAILEKAYGVSISFDDKILRGCSVTAPLADESLFEKLDLICKVTRSSYEVIDGQIVVTSRGCK